MPNAGFILILDVGGIAGNVLLGRDSLGCGESSGPAGKGLREDIVELVRPAAIVRDDPVVDSCHPNCSAVILRES